MKRLNMTHQQLSIPNHLNCKHLGFANVDIVTWPLTFKKVQLLVKFLKFYLIWGFQHIFNGTDSDDCGVFWIWYQPNIISVKVVEKVRNEWKWFLCN